MQRYATVEYLTFQLETSVDTAEMLADRVIDYQKKTDDR
jgi:uncharacterized protein YutE (UPF0331/DUF86 family)